MSEIITCLSGLGGRLRGMKAREEQVLADRELARSGAPSIWPRAGIERLVDSVGDAHGNAP